MSADRILALKAGLNGTPIPVGAASGGGSIDGKIGYKNLDFGTEISAPGFAFAAIYNASFVNFGRIVPCSPGDSFKALWTPGSNNMPKAAYIYSSEVPTQRYGSLSGAIGSIDTNQDNVYTIPSNLSGATFAFFPIRFAGYSTGTHTEEENNTYIENNYGNSSAYQLYKVGGASIDIWYLKNQNQNFFVDADKNAVFYASLFAAVSDLVGSKIAILGDSLTEQSAGWNGASGITEYKNLILDGYGWASRFARKYMMRGIIHGVGQQWWYSTTAKPNGGTAAVRKLVDSNYVPDYIILEYGTNDILSGSLGTYEDSASETATATAGAMRWCIETLQSTYPSAKILVVMPCLHSDTGGLPPAKQETYYSLANAILDDYAIMRVDMAHESGIVYSMMGNSDGVHLAVPPSGGSDYNNDTVAVEKYSRAIEKALLNL